MQQARQLARSDRHVSPVQPSRHPVYRPEPDRRAKKVKLLLIFITCFLLSLVVVAQYSTLVIMNYRLSSARTALAESLEASRLLELEVANLSAVGRIEAIAREELGMVDPEIGQIKVIKAGLNGGLYPGE